MRPLVLLAPPTVVPTRQELWTLVAATAGTLPMALEILLCVRSVVRVLTLPTVPILALFAMRVQRRSQVAKCVRPARVATTQH